MGSYPGSIVHLLTEGRARSNTGMSGERLENGLVWDDLGRGVWCRGDGVGLL